MNIQQYDNCFVHAGNPAKTSVSSREFHNPTCRAAAASRNSRSSVYRCAARPSTTASRRASAATSRERPSRASHGQRTAYPYSTACTTALHTAGVSLWWRCCTPDASILVPTAVRRRATRERPPRRANSSLKIVSNCYKLVDHNALDEKLFKLTD